MKYDVNDAYYYLKDKYGYKRLGYTSSAASKLARKPKKKQEQIIATFTDRDYHLVLNPITEEKDIELKLLMHQYYYGIPAKYDLNNLLTQILE